MNKKDIPIDIVKTVEDFISTNQDLISVKAEEGSYYALRDKDSHPNFFFFVYTQKKGNGSNQVNEVMIEYCPSETSNLTHKRSVINVKNLRNFLDIWKGFLEAYEQTHSVYDDPILEGYTKQFYNAFTTFNESDNEGLEIPRLLEMDKFLAFIEAEVLKEKAIEPESAIELDDINSDIGLLRKFLSRSSKQVIRKKLSSIFAKLQKHKTTFIHDILSEAKKKGIKFLLDKGIELAQLGYETIVNG